MLSPQEKKENLAIYLNIPAQNITIRGEFLEANGNLFFAGKDSDIFNKIVELVNNNIYMYFRKENNILVMLKEKVFDIKDYFGSNYLLLNKDNIESIISICKKGNYNSREVLVSLVSKIGIKNNEFDSEAVVRRIKEFKEEAVNVFDNEISILLDMFGDEEKDMFSNKELKKINKYIQMNLENFTEEGLSIIYKYFSTEDILVNDIELEDIAQALTGMGPENNDFLLDLVGGADSFVKNLVQSNYKSGGLSSYLHISGSPAYHDNFGYYYCNVTGLF